MTTANSWAVLLIQLSDQEDVPFDRSYAERMFTSAGNGTRNIVDYFREMSHGQLDVGASRVFGWFKVAYTRQQYTDRAMELQALDMQNGTDVWIGTLRQELIDVGRAAAAGNTVDLAGYAGVVTVFSGPVDTFGRGGDVVLNHNSNDLDFFSVDLTISAHEMAHGMGLSHSRRSGSADEYGDQWDIMSSYSVYYANDNSPVPRPYRTFGPGMNAVNMDMMGWLDASRVFTAGKDGIIPVELRPLHRRDLPGYLAARVGPWLVEFRVAAGWDVAIPRAAILVHQRSIHPQSGAAVSELLGAQVGNQTVFDLQEGDEMELGDPRFTDWRSVRVLSIDAASERAIVDIGVRARNFWQTVDGPNRFFGGIEVGGGGIIITPNGTPIPVDPVGPLARIVEHVGMIQQVQRLAIPPTLMRSTVRQSLRSLQADADAMIAAGETFCTPSAEQHVMRRESGADNQQISGA